VIVYIIRRKPVLTYASIIFGGMLASILVLVLEVDGLCSQSAEDAHIVPVSIQPVLERVDRRCVDDFMW